MRNRITFSLLLTMMGLEIFAVPAHAKNTPATAPADSTSTQTDQQREQAYTDSIDKRSTKIIDALHLDDSTKASAVKDILIAHYRALRDWQTQYQPGKEKFAQASKNPDAKDALAKIHDQFNSQLSAQLTPQQVEAVKDQLTVNKVRVTYDAYVQIVPNLTDEEKSHMLALLDEAREQAIDCGSMADKSAVFKVYKGKINVYLDKDGHNVSKAYKDWGQAQKAKQQGAATQPAESVQTD